MRPAKTILAIILAVGPTLLTRAILPRSGQSQTITGSGSPDIDIRLLPSTFWETDLAWTDSGGTIRVHDGLTISLNNADEVMNSLGVRPIRPPRSQSSHRGVIEDIKTFNRYDIDAAIKAAMENVKK